MKAYILPIAIVSAICITAGAEYDKKELKRLEEAEIAGVRSDTVKNDDREKSEVLEINTFENQDYSANQGYTYQMHAVVELKDKDKKTYFVDLKFKQPDGLDSEYTGEDYWDIIMPYGDLDRVKVNAYAVQYGFMDGDTYVPTAEEYSGCKTMDELKERTTTPFPNEVKVKHYHMYDDPNEGEVESIRGTLRIVK